MANTLGELASKAKVVYEAKQVLRDAEREQTKFIVANADELVDRGLLKISVSWSKLHTQLRRETDPASFREMR